MRRPICAISLVACVAACVVACAVACGDREPGDLGDLRPTSPPPSRFELSIARELTARVGEPPTVHCATVYGMPRGCTATLAEGTKLPIRLRPVGTQVRWQVDGLVVKAAPIEDYLRGVLEDLGAAQAVDCGARLRRLAPGDRVACALARGGTAFVTVAADGALALEVALDPAAAKARTDVVTDLEVRSKALDRTALPFGLAHAALRHTEDADEDEGAPSDAKVESRP